VPPAAAAHECGADPAHPDCDAADGAEQEAGNDALADQLAEWRHLHAALRGANGSGGAEPGDRLAL